MSDAPWFKFYPADWLSGTRGLNATEAGVYIALIAMMYDHGKPLAMDETRLARYCGASLRQFAAALSRLVEDGKIIPLPDGLWNERVGAELQSREEKICGAKKAAFARHSEKAERNQSLRDANASRSQSERNAISEVRSQKLEGVSKDTPPPAPDPELPLQSKPALVDLATAQGALDAYNAMAEKAGLAKAQRLTDQRRKQLAHRLRECGGLDGWNHAMAKVAASSFLTGKVKPWRADLDFILQASSFTKIMEGSYDNKPAPQRKPGGFSAQDALRGLYGGGEEDRFAV